MNYQEILESTYFGNSVQNYLLAIVWLLVGLLLHSWISNLFIRFIARLFRKSEFNLTREEYKGHVQKSLNLFLLLVFIYLAFNHLDFPKEWNMAPTSEFGIKLILKSVYQLTLAVAVTRMALNIVTIFGVILHKRAGKTESKQDDQLIPFVVEVSKILLIIFSFLIIVSTVFNLNVGSLVAGLGIGGLAIALAAKESLENLFSSFTIFLDKPFVVGDMVTVGSTTGVVEKVGFRSTRLRTLEKSFLTIPNRLMIDAELDNLSLRTFRRVKFDVGLTYGTKATVIKSVCDKIQTFLIEHAHTNEDSQVRFMEFGSSSLNIMVLYYVDTMDWDLYLQYKEEINYKIMEIVEMEESDFAFPTQTIHLEKNNS